MEKLRRRQDDGVCFCRDCVIAEQEAQDLRTGPNPGLVVLVIVAVVAIGAAVLRHYVKSEPVRTYTSSCDYAGQR